MASAADYFRANSIVPANVAAKIRAIAIRNDQDIQILDPVLDQQWSKSAWTNSQQKRPSSYFDYFFTGQDIQVRVAEVPDTDPRGDLPIVQLAYSIEQEKQPVYGYWDYTYSAVMRGTRLISGAFTLATKYPDYMKEVVATAAHNRATKTLVDNYNYPQDLTEDDKNIEQYWGKSLFDPGVVAQAGQSLFSTHPPFNFIITYGMQPVSSPLIDTSADWEGFYSASYDYTKGDLVADVNHRLVESDPTYQNRVVLEAVELKSCQREYSPDGAVCSETYAFFARDAFVPMLPTATPTSG